MTNETLRNLCIENDWFTCGDNSQYEKLFEMNDNGATTKELATIIWLCSSDVTLVDVETELNKENLPKLSVTYLEETLRANHWGELEVGLICRAIRESTDNGTSYTTI